MGGAASLFGGSLALLLGASDCTPLVADSGPPPVPDAGSGPADATTADSADSAESAEVGPEADGRGEAEASCVTCTLGATECGEDSVYTCVTTTPGCTSWGDTNNCSMNGACVLDTAGHPTCACTPGSFCASQQRAGTQCDSAGGYVNCAVDTSGCYYPVGDAGTCPSGQSCVGSAPDASCSPTCQDQCAAGDTTCNGGGVASCALQPSGCYAWGAPEPCPQDEVCSGTTKAACACVGSPYCSKTNQGAPFCTSPTAYATCGFDSNGCPTLGSPTSCPTASTCIGGNCMCNDGGFTCLDPQLWLTADQGLECSGGTATAWTDLSPQHRAVTAVTAAPGLDGEPVGAHLGPSCNVPGHTLNGVAVPYFGDPADGPPYVNGTLDVDLSFLSGSPFTIFVVERRWAPPRLVGQANFYLGTLLPPGGTPSYSTLQVGFVSYNPCPELVIDLLFDGALNVTSPVPATGPAPAEIDAFRSDGEKPGQVWVDGVAQTNGALTSGVLSKTYEPYQVFGSVGRALYLDQLDARFDGDIAEILVFDTALGDPDRAIVERYLEQHWGGGFPNLGTGGTCP
jgi:hypothetical protein